MGIMTKNNIGSRAEVMHGNASKTSGNLTKKDLEYNKIGKIVSKKASNSAKKNKNLGNFLVQKNSKGFSRLPKKGSKEYKEILNSKKSMKKSRKSMKKSRKSRKVESKSRKSYKMDCRK